MNSDFDYAGYRQGIEAVVLRCLEKDPTQRYQSADELRLDLECLSENKIPRISKLPSQDKAVDEKLAKTENFEGALALVVLLAILVLVLALRLLQPVT